jgi:TPP-dependent 2-oxoacid decarboxylase
MFELAAERHRRELEVAVERSKRQIASMRPIDWRVKECVLQIDRVIQSCLRSMRRTTSIDSILNVRSMMASLRRRESSTQRQRPPDFGNSTNSIIISIVNSKKSTTILAASKGHLTRVHEKLSVFSVTCCSAASTNTFELSILPKIVH